jgi:hypothetical protein
MYFWKCFQSKTVVFLAHQADLQTATGVVGHPSARNRYEIVSLARREENKMPDTAKRYPT